MMKLLACVGLATCFCAMSAPVARVQTFTVIHAFTDGGWGLPLSGLFGTTELGGTPSCIPCGILASVHAPFHAAKCLLCLFQRVPTKSQLLCASCDSTLPALPVHALRHESCRAAGGH